MRLLVVSGLFLLMQDLTLNSVEYSVSKWRHPSRSCVRIAEFHLATSFCSSTVHAVRPRCGGP